MKFKSFNRVLAALLMLTMLAGQVLMSTAMALNEEPGIVILDESDLLETEPTPTPAAEPPEGGELPAEGGMPTPGAAETIEISEDDLTATPTPMPVEPTDTPEASPTIEPTVTPLTAENGIMLLGDTLEDGDGGLSITVNSDRTTVQDGDEYIFSVGIKDDDLTKEPNIKAGDKVTIKLPEFLEIEKFPNQLQQYFNWPPEYDKNTHTITLTFEDIKPGAQSLNVQFSITARVNTIGYDGDGQGSIEVGLGKVKKISTNIGLDTGAGEGSEQGEPYLVKSIWSNGRPNGERYIMKETDKPIGYSVGFGVNSGNGAVITFADDMSSGNLALCSVNGDTSAPLENCITRVTINGSAVLPTKVENGRLVFSHEKLGTMTISKQGKGFKAEITTKAEEQSEFVEVGIRYFAVIVGDAVNATNTATLTIGGEESYNDNATIIRYESQGAVVWKRALDNGKEVTVIDITETDSITFRIKINQYGEGSLYKDGDVIAFDDLEPCLTYDQTAESSIRGPFRIEANNNRLNIVKIGKDPIPAGEYNIDFRVKVNKEKLDYGNATTNTVGNTVTIRRKAKLTINKTWADGKQIGKGAEFSLLDGKKVIARAQSKENGPVTLYISADDLKSGQHTYVLKETVDENSGYSSVKDKEVVITKADNTITINSIDGQNNASGEARVSITNTPDSGVGSVTFKKLGEGKEQIGGVRSSSGRKTKAAMIGSRIFLP